jgi:hypothetical protein
MRILPPHATGRARAKSLGKYAILFAILPAAAATIAGCAAIGLGAGAVTRTMVKPAYKGLAGQTVGIMVASDRGTQIEHRRLQLDVAQSLDGKLKATQANKVEELKGTEFPRTAGPDAIFAFQRNYPQYEWEPVATIAPKFGVTRVIHIEVSSFTLHPDNVPELFRGEMIGRVQVVEVAGGTGKVAFNDSITATFPPNSNAAGTPNLDAQTTYRGAIEAFTTAVVERFVTHEEQ